MACCISGIGSATINLFTLLATTFIYCKVLVFQMKDPGLHDLVYNNLKDLSEYEIVRTLRTTFRSLKSQVLWSPSESNNVDMEGEMTYLNLAMNKRHNPRKGYRYMEMADLKMKKHGT